MKKLVTLLAGIFFVFVMVSCEDPENKKDDENLNDEEVTDVTDQEEVKDEEVTDDVEECTLNEEWLSPATEWTAWGFLRMSGEIGDYEGEYVEATFTEGKMKIASGMTELKYGAFSSYQGTVLLADAANYEFINQTATSATVDYYDAMWQFNPQLIPLFKEDGVNEADFGAFVWFRHSFIDLTISGNSITGQKTRKNCWLAIAATEELEEEGTTYDIPVGGIYGCFGGNVDGSVGETLKMMFRNKMTDSRDDILAFINTLEDETVLKYGDEGFRFECECYNENGATQTPGENEVPCWHYDGPGGAEECPAEVKEAGKCDEGAPDEDVVDEDVVDEDIVDEDTTDDDPYVNPCTVNPCNEANKTVCTDTNLDGVAECACDVDYHLNNSNACKSNTKQEPCDQTDVTVPANAAIVVVDVDVTWNIAGGTWNATPKCDWACDAGYEENVAGDACDAIADPCNVTPDPCNDLTNAVDDSCDPEEVTSGVYTGVFSCDCDTNFTWTVDQCVAD